MQLRICTPSAAAEGSTIAARDGGRIDGFRWPALREYLLHDSCRKVGGESFALSVELIIEMLIVESQLVQDRRVEIGNTHRILNCSEPQIIRGAIDRSPFDAPAGQPETERL